MGVIHVQEPGLFTTVQDLGREGYGPLGVSPSGAADAISLRMGNRLVANAEGEAGLEMTLLGGTFAFPEGALLALTGSDFGATLDGKPVEMCMTFEARGGQVLRLGPTRSGARCYLCVQGGIDVELFLGSASTHILSGLGGHQGRALRKGDVLKIGARRWMMAEKWPAHLRKREWILSKRVMRILEPRKVLCVTAGPQSDWFPEASQQIFFGSTYRVAEESNRMGIRLEGPPILRIPSGAQEETGQNAGPTGTVGEMISEGVTLGAVQVPEGGMPIILFVEQQTTGGYPKIANVISADFHSLGQLRPRDEIRFERVERETAPSMLRFQEMQLAGDLWRKGQIG
jgi:antagonist of KipI